MLNEMESVIFLKGGQEYIGQVIGCEKEYFWLLVSGLGNVYVGHPNRVFESSGKKYFEAFDHCQSVSKIFNGADDPESYILDYCENPKKIIQLLKMGNLIGMV